MKRYVGPAAAFVIGAVGVLALIAVVDSGDGGAAAQSTGPARIGFGSPVVISHTAAGAEIDDPVVAVSPTGSTAVMWRDASGFGKGQTYKADYLVSLGPDAAHLSKPKPIIAAGAAAKATGGYQLLGLPDGGFVACFNESGRRHGTTTTGCSFAAPGKNFGPLRVVERKPWKQASTIQASIRTDGTVLLLTTRSLGTARRSITVDTLTPAGRLATLQRLGEVRGSAAPVLATTTDGGVAVAWSNGPTNGDDFEANSTPVLRLMAAGANEFGAPVTFSPDRKIASGVGLTGGAALLVDYSTDQLSDAMERRIVRRLPDGTFSAPKTLPRPGKGFVSGHAFPLADGTPFTITSSDEQSETDCGDSTGGSVGVGPLVDLDPNAQSGSGTTGPVTAQRLSDPKQIAQYPTAAQLGDGTIIAAWGDSFGRNGQSRVEVTTRRPDAATFTTPQVLPRDTVYGGQALAAGGDQALLAWTAGRNGTRRDVVVSALRTSPPFATQQPRPKDPATSCQ